MTAVYFNDPTNDTLEVIKISGEWDTIVHDQNSVPHEVTLEYWIEDEYIHIEGNIMDSDLDVLKDEVREIEYSHFEKFK